LVTIGHFYFGLTHVMQSLESKPFLCYTYTMCVKIFRNLFIAFFICFSFSLLSGAEDLPNFFPKEGIKGYEKKAPVIVNGDKVEYLHDQKKITGTGNIKITYGDVKLFCDKIVVHTETK